MLVVRWLVTSGGVAVAVVMGGAWLTRLLDQRYVDVAWIEVKSFLRRWACRRQDVVVFEAQRPYGAWGLVAFRVRSRAVA